MSEFAEKLEAYTDALMDYVNRDEANRPAWAYLKTNADVEYAAVTAHVDALTAEVARLTKLGTTVCDENENLYEQREALRKALLAVAIKRHYDNPRCIADTFEKCDRSWCIEIRKLTALQPEEKI